MNGMKTTILLSYICVASFSAAIITPALPQIQTVFHLTQGNLNWVVTIFLIGYMIAQLIYAPLANRYGRLTALRIGFTINLLGIVLSLVSVACHSYFLLLVARAITALGAAAGLSCTFILINESFTEVQAKHALSYAVVSFTAGIGLAVLIGGMVTQYIGWSATFWILLVHGLLALASTWAFKETLKEKKAVHVKAIFQNYATAFKSKKLISYALFLGFVSVISYCYSAGAPIIAQTFLHLTTSQYGYWNLLVMVGMLAGGISAASVLKHYDMTHVLWVSLGMIAIGIVSLLTQALLQIPNVIWFFITISFIYLFAGWLFPCASFFASNAISDKASASSSMSFINIASAVISVAIMGYLPFNIFLALGFILAIFLTSFVIINLFWRT